MMEEREGREKAKMHRNACGHTASELVNNRTTTIQVKEESVSLKENKEGRKG